MSSPKSFRIFIQTAVLIVYQIYINLPANSTKRIIYATVLFFLTFSAGISQGLPLGRSEPLRLVIEKAVEEKCMLTELTVYKEIMLDKEKLEIWINFNNKGMHTFWSPEVAVQYIFDASLSPIMRAVWQDRSGRFSNIPKMVFHVDIAPHDIPPLLVFEIRHADWASYIKGGKKEDLYKRMKVTEQDIPFVFDPHEASLIE
jgi:hypothetical protein